MAEYTRHRNRPGCTPLALSKCFLTYTTASLAAKFDQGNGDTPPPLSFRKSNSSERITPVEKIAPVEKPVERSFERPTERLSEQPAERAYEKPVASPATRPAPLERASSSDALSRIPPPMLHSMRESFSVMDRDNDGHVNSADVADMLSQLGLSATPSQLSSYFNGAQSINLATYLNTLSDLLGGLSHANELTAAFEAFDDGDDGQIDLSELKDALLHTAPESGEHKLTEREIDMVIEGFRGRRIHGKGGKSLGRAEVFRYQDFLSSLTGGGNEGENGAAVAPA
ncbi:hypothetical protein LEMA_P119730.1 [Plenodomus lingam JN3]|uniref:EF-hand domain-containing protein n=1 Tax=Leptosphaeria maculans (strain JN3 / isolate v23.1.3 / race Av1-4-5-6-7-8) TaxID=985895 RepID=E4ZT51_LEPMJ|nr:hypothetical protein LEMA_P119730.1 [Plenodomus lingam JN3]CBX94482.1 hypothetical protein LEMA_P119730.1 [Plenodomus lingam JN3]